MSDLPVMIGETAAFTKTITSADIQAFADLTGDYDPVHLDDDYASASVFGRRIAHGGLVMGLLSTTASEISRRAVQRGSRGVSVSLGYDRIRFLKPVFIGDTLTAHYAIMRSDPAKDRTLAHVEVRNQDGDLCLAGTHVMKWLPAAVEPAEASDAAL